MSTISATIQRIWEKLGGRSHLESSEQRIEPGTTVTWSSQAGGRAKTKTGIVMVFVPRREKTVAEVYPEILNVPSGSIQFDNITYPSTFDRYLVKVPKLNENGEETGKNDYYTPTAAKLERSLGISKSYGTTANNWQEKDGYQFIKTEHYEITLEVRPTYCDRGRFLAKVFAFKSDISSFSLDHQDGWPRYYFSEKNAKYEIEEWLRFRGEL